MEQIWKQYVLNCFEVQKPELSFQIIKCDKQIQNEVIGICDGLRDVGKEIESLDINIKVGSNLRKEDWERLGEGLSQCSDVKKIKIVFEESYLIPDVMKHISDGIATCSRVDSLYLQVNKGNHLGCEDGKYLGNAISQLKQLKRLVIDIEQENKLLSEGLIDLCAGISKCIQMKALSLNITQNVIFAKAMLSFTDVFSSLTQLTSLQLSLKNVSLSDMGAKLIGLAFPKAVALTKLYLTLKDETIKSKGWQCICNGISECKQLELLDFDPTFPVRYGEECLDFSQLGCQGIQNILFRCSNLQVFIVKLDQCLICDLGFQLISEGLERSTNLTQLNMSYTSNPQISQKGIEKMFKRVEKLTNLSQLKLKQDMYSEKCLTINSFYSVRKLSQIQILDLSQMNISSLITQQLPGFLSCLNDLSQVYDLKLDMSYCRQLHPKEIYTIFKHLARKKSLRILYFCSPYYSFKTHQSVDPYMRLFVRIIFKSKYLVKFFLRILYLTISK